jgi:hypothetical protein
LVFPSATAPWSASGARGTSRTSKLLGPCFSKSARIPRISTTFRVTDCRLNGRLPVIQYTAREVRSGLLFWAFAQQRSSSATVFASRIQQHLERYGVSLRDVVWQTDNGGEFKGDFPAALGDRQHVRIPPAAHTYQSEVEMVHRLEEDEFFDLEDFSSRGDFLAKVHTYQLYFNLVRPNSHKENHSPWQIIERLAPRSPLELCLLPPVFLDYYLNDRGGYDVPRLPSPGTKACDAVSARLGRSGGSGQLYRNEMS